jgi:hypothetical protein
MAPREFRQQELAPSIPISMRSSGQELAVLWGHLLAVLVGALLAPAAALWRYLAAGR